MSAPVRRATRPWAPKRPSLRSAAILFLLLSMSACAGLGPMPTAAPAATLAPSPAAPTASLAAPLASPAPTGTFTALPLIVLPLEPTATSAPPPTQPPAPPRVVIISIDGLRPDALLQVNAPYLQGLARRGAFSWQAQTIYPSATLPAHASMLSGLSPEDHGLSWNDFRPDLGDIAVPTVFSLARDAGLRTIAVVGKQKMIHLFGEGGVDAYAFALNGDRDVVDQAIALAAGGFDLMFVHLPNTDFFGHSTGWMSQTYLYEITRTDIQVGRLLAALPADVTVIVTADHGGHGLGHGSRSPEDMTIPWIMAGPGVRRGHQLVEPVGVAATAATAAHLLGLSLPSDSAAQPILEALDASPPAALSLLEGFWTQGAAQRPARSEMPAAVLDGLIYVPGGFGGETDFQAYDPARDAWLNLAPLPAGRHHLMAAAAGGRIYVFGGAPAGGWAPTNTVFVYDPASDSWAEAAPMPEARVSGAAVALGDRLYVVGGVGGSGALLEYDPAADAWQVRASLRQPREHVAAAALNGEIYALGGRWSVVGEMSTVEIYDPAADAWRPGPDLPRPMAGFNAAALDGRILAAGGEIIMRGNETLAAFVVYDPRSAAWSAGPDLPHPLHGVPAAAQAGRFYLLGGSSRAGAIDNQGLVFIYTP